MKITRVPLILLFCFAPFAAAGELEGVKMDATADVAGKTVKLQGMGLRTKLMFKVYVAGLYLETPDKDAAKVIAADEVKRVQLHLVRDLAGGKIAEAIVEGFERNSKAEMPKLKERLDRMTAMIPDVKIGDVIVFTYVPGKGTDVTVKGESKGTLEGKDFGDALFAVWLGASPVQEDLKAALLGS
ncbi:MAG: chalcone isomerase family protein [Acidobacteriota bacterium]